jgi:serine/threonine protein kinase
VINLERELTIQSSLNHPNIVKISEMFERRAGEIWFVMEYMEGGDLFDFVHENKVSESEAKLLFRQIVGAIRHLHSKNIVHRDIKLENFLLDKSQRIVKLADFGFSNQGTVFETSCGSPYYSAPEIFLGTSYGKEVDIWSLGVVFYAVVTRSLPFIASDLPSLMRKILNCEYEFPTSISPGCKELIQKMIVCDPSKRLTIEEVRKNPWLSSPIPPVELSKLEQENSSSLEAPRGAVPPLIWNSTKEVSPRPGLLLTPRAKMEASLDARLLRSPRTRGLKVVSDKLTASN